MEAVELEKQKHNSTRMEALTRMAKLEVLHPSTEILAFFFFRQLVTAILGRPLLDILNSCGSLVEVLVLQWSILFFTEVKVFADYKC